jgi:indolepyruvate ferredoxin oxidoreductase
MAYKDEYEVARLHLDPAVRADIEARFGPDARVFWHLHPPILRALGFKKKIRFGSWFTPAFRALRALRGLRGTALDIFGRAEVRREERRLIDEYRALVETALERLAPATHDTAVAISLLPEEIRGYEHIKLEGVARFRDRAKQLIAQLN